MKLEDVQKKTNENLHWDLGLGEEFLGMMPKTP